MPSVSKRGARTQKFSGSNGGNFGILSDRKSAFVETPGNDCSFGLPSVLKIKYNSSSTFVPGKSGFPQTIS